MATFLQLDALRFFLPVFTFLFILVVIYAILHKTNFLGDSKVVKLIVSFTIASISLLSGRSSQLINFVTPWIVFIVIFLVLMFMILIFLGTNEEKAWDTVGGRNLYFIIAILIVVIGISQVYEGVFTPFAEEEGGRTIGGETLRTIFHPRVLGAIFIIVVAGWTIKNLGADIENK